MRVHVWSMAVPVLCAALTLVSAASGAVEATDTRPVREQRPPAAQAQEAREARPGAKDDDPETVLDGPLDFSAIEMLAIQEGGRKKPLHTYAYEQMEQLVGRPIFSSAPYLKEKTEEPGKTRRLEAMDLFLSMWLQTRNWSTVPVVLVPFKLAREVGLDETQKHFSVDQINGSPGWKKLSDEAMNKRHNGQEAAMNELEKDAEVVGQRMQMMGAIVHGIETLNIVPHPTDINGTWLSLKALDQSYSADSQQMYYSRETGQAAIEKFRSLVRAYHKRNPEEFSTASREFRTALASMSPRIYPKFDALSREVSYNKLRPFGKAWVFYLAAVVLGMLALKLKGTPAYCLLMGAYFLGLGFHVYGFALRCLIAGRPPVSNMYESVIWVGFGAVFFGLIFELIYKKRYYALSGAGGGFLCLVLMDLLPAVMGNSAMPGFEAQIRPLVPVLRDNFWLTVHVLTITLSYAAFLLAWALGHVTLFSHLTRPAERAHHHELHQFVYRVMQVGVLLLATGTILGGVWAYYSWGRFWGWDPKETWAFIALMCYLVVLHGRFTGWWSNFGLCVGSVVCFQAIMMAWYGVNFVLGSGMHAYGSGAGGQQYVLTAVGVDAVFTIAAVSRYLSYKHTGPGPDDPPDDDHTLTATDPVDEVRATFADKALN